MQQAILAAFINFRAKILALTPDPGFVNLSFGWVVLSWLVIFSHL
jgi:hypothetical protein